MPTIVKDTVVGAKGKLTKPEVLYPPLEGRVLIPPGSPKRFYDQHRNLPGHWNPTVFRPSPHPMPPGRLAPIGNIIIGPNAPPLSREQRNMLNTYLNVLKSPPGSARPAIQFPQWVMEYVRQYGMVLPPKTNQPYQEPRAHPARY